MKRARWKALLFGLFLFISLSLGTILFTGSQTARTVWAYGETLQDKIEIFRLILQTLQKSYVEERSADELLEGAIHGMLAQLDPHTNYLPRDNFRKWNKGFEGFTGIGIYFDIVGNYPMITGFLDDSPAARTSLKSGDFIVKIDETSTRGLSQNEIENAFMRIPGESIQLTIYRQAARTKKVVRVQKSHLYVQSINGAYLLENGIGYVNITRFTGTTAGELDDALKILKAKGMKNLIMDLRDNGGGYLSAAVDVADRFLPRGRLIVYTRGRLPRSKQEYRATQYHTFENLPVTILLNHGTASAAEIVAGALQDWDRALIVGTTSFGKGLVQSQFRFRDGSALLVTTAKYYTPLGRLIQRDYFGLSKDEYYAAAYKINSRQAAWKGSGKKAYKTPMGRTVYGGGGITPDIWAENTHGEISEAIRALYFSPEKFFYKFALEKINELDYLRRYSPRQVANLAISQDDLRNFETLLEKSGYKISYPIFWRNAKDITFLLRREIAYLLGGEEARFWVNLERDQQLEVARQNAYLARQLIQVQPIAQALKHNQNP